MPPSSEGFVLWFTGLSAAGKSTVASIVANELARRGIEQDRLDGDEVRSFFEGDMGYTREERRQNIRRIAFAARLLARHGVAVLVANIAPYDDLRRWIRARIPRFALVYLATDLATCRARDRKGVYLDSGPIIGVDEPYEPPEDAEIVLGPDFFDPEEGARRVMAWVQARGWISPCG